MAVRARWLAVGAWLLAGAARAPARTFSDILGTDILRPVGQSLGESIGRALPVISASPGVVYTFDPETGAVCTPLDQCQAAGTCDPDTGARSNPPRETGRAMTAASAHAPTRARTGPARAETR